MHPVIRVTVSVRTSTSAYDPAAIHVVEERSVPIVEIDAPAGPTIVQWHTLAHVIEEYAERAVSEAQGQARELADHVPNEAPVPPSDDEPF